MFCTFSYIILIIKFHRADYETEACYMKILKNELDELFKIISARDQSVEWQKSKIELQQKKLEDLIKQMVIP